MIWRREWLKHDMRRKFGASARKPSANIDRRVPFAFLYEYRPVERQARLASVSAEIGDDLHPAVIDCNSESIWRFHTALSEDCLVVKLGQRASLSGRVGIHPWLAVACARKPRFCQSACASIVRRRRSWCWESILAARLTTLIANSFAGSRNKSPSGWPALARMSRSVRRAEALAEIDRAKTAFFSNVSHEFRTPLALMLGPLEEVLPEARERLSPERHEQLVTVRRNAVRLLKLVNTLLDFSRIEAGRVQAVYEPTDLSGVTAEIASVFRSAMENAGLAVFGGMPANRRTRVRRPRHVGEGGLESSVQCVQVYLRGLRDGHVEVDGSAVQLQVRDTGVGIPEEHRERVFERFHRIEGTHARTFEGTGIGLAFVQELVRLHGGDVRVESALGQGSTFTVTIPLGTAHLPPERIQAARSIASPGVMAGVTADCVRRGGAGVVAGRVESGRRNGASQVGILTPLPQPEPAARPRTNRRGRRQRRYAQIPQAPAGRPI